MKKYFKSLSEIISILLLITLPSMSKAQSIVGSWQLNVNASLDLSSAQAKARYDTIPQPIKQQIYNSFNGKQFTFTQDGILLINSNDTAAPVQGTWSYKPGSNNKVLVATTGSDTNEFDVVMLTSSVLVLELNDTGGAFEKLYLNKKS